MNKGFILKKNCLYNIRATNCNKNLKVIKNASQIGAVGMVSHCRVRMARRLRLLDDDDDRGARARDRVRGRDRRGARGGGGVAVACWRSVRLLDAVRDAKLARGREPGDRRREGGGRRRRVVGVGAPRRVHRSRRKLELRQSSRRRRGRIPRRLE